MYLCFHLGAEVRNLFSFLSDKVEEEDNVKSVAEMEVSIVMQLE